MQALNAYGFQNAMPYIGPAYSPTNFTPTVQFAPPQSPQQAVPVATSQIFNAAEAEMNNPAALAANASLTDEAAAALAGGIASAAEAAGAASAADTANAKFSGGCCKLNYFA